MFTSNRSWRARFYIHVRSHKANTGYWIRWCDMNFINVFDLPK
jgi:hypothetical protein